MPSLVVSLLLLLVSRVVVYVDSPLILLNIDVVLAIGEVADDVVMLIVSVINFI